MIAIRLKFGKSRAWALWGVADEECDFSVPGDCTIENVKETLSELCGGVLRADQLRLCIDGSADELTDYAGAEHASTSNHQPPQCTLAYHGVKGDSVLEVDLVLSDKEAEDFGIPSKPEDQEQQVPPAAGVSPEAAHAAAAPAAPEVHNLVDEDVEVIEILSTDDPEDESDEPEGESDEPEGESDEPEGESSELDDESDEPEGESGDEDDYEMLGLWASRRRQPPAHVRALADEGDAMEWTGREAGSVRPGASRGLLPVKRPYSSLDAAAAPAGAKAKATGAAKSQTELGRRPRSPSPVLRHQRPRQQQPQQPQPRQQQPQPRQQQPQQPQPQQQPRQQQPQQPQQQPRPRQQQEQSPQQQPQQPQQQPQQPQQQPQQPQQQPRQPQQQPQQPQQQPQQPQQQPQQPQQQPQQPQQQPQQPQQQPQQTQQPQPRQQQQQPRQPQQAEATDGAQPSGAGFDRGRKSPKGGSGHWSVQEVEELAAAMEKHGKHWVGIERETNLRDQKYLRYKWRNIVASCRTNWIGTRGVQLPRALRERLNALYRLHGA